MNNFTLTLPPNCHRNSPWLEKLDEIINIQRKFQSLRVELKWRDCQKEIQTLNSILRHHGFHLRHLTLSSVCFFTSRDFCDILRNLPLLKKLLLNYVRFELEENFHDQKVSMENLKTVKINNCSWTFLRFFSSPNLKSIEILYGNFCDRYHLMTFLESSDSLKSMTIDGSALNVIFQQKVETKFPFQLETLHILSKFSYEKSTKVDRNFRNFLESQTKLEHFRFGSMS